MPPRKIKVVDLINDIEDVPQDLKINPSEQEIPEAVEDTPETAPLEQDTPETVEEQTPVEEEPQPQEEVSATSVKTVELVECPDCKKKMTKKTLKYSHAKNCTAKKVLPVVKEEDEEEKDEEETEEVEGEDVITSTDDETIDSESDDFISNERIDRVPESNKEYEPMFWVFYPDARKTLTTAFALNEKNMSKPISFDRLINSRRFSATIYKEANVYQDRDIRDYIRNNSLMQLLESERIKEKIRNKEQDMWSY